MKSQAQPTLHNRIISLSCALPRARGARLRGDRGSLGTVTLPAASGLGGHSRLTATRWARGRAIPPPRAAATGARRDTRAAPGPVGSGEAVRAQGWVNSTDPRLPEAPPGKARASGGPRRRRPRPRPFSRFYDRREPAQGQRGGAPGPGPVSKAAAARGPLGAPVPSPSGRRPALRRSPPGARRAPRPARGPARTFPPRLASPGAGVARPTPPPRRSPAGP